MPLTTGTRLGPYEIVGLLGAGGMGEVYRARDTRLQRDVALKRLSDPELAGNVARDRVLHEARAAGALTHPNIAAIHDVIDTPDGLVIVMEYVPGESLAARLRRGPLPAEEALDIARQVADALAEAHDRGIVHRDLKPANILVNASGRPKILDFGIARATLAARDRSTTSPEVSTEAGQIIGTPGYMAPEQLAGGRADQRTDIYGVGVLLFEMLTGRSPFESRDYVGHALEVFEGRTPRVTDLAPDVPASVSAIVSRAMARRPEDRFGTARDLSASIGQATHDLSNANTVAGGPQPPRAWWKSRPAVALLLVIGLIAGTVITRARWWSPAPLSSQSAVVGVLPFQEESGSAADAALVVGLTDSVSKRLASVRSLRVLPLDETRQAAREQPDRRRLARTLGAGCVVDGTLRRTGDALAVRVGLVLEDGTRKEVGTYEGQVDRLFELHRQVADGIVASLAREGVADVSAARTAGAPTTDQDAYADYAQARTFLERPDVPGNLDRAITLFQSAIRRDSRFALAYAGLGEAYWAQYNETKDPAWTAKAQGANLEALRIDSALPEVRMALAVMYEGSGRVAQAREELQQVIAQQPQNDTAYRLLAKMDADQGKWEEAIAEARQAIALRPNYWANHSELGDILRAAGRFDEAAGAYRRFAELQPDSARAFQRLGTSLQEAGRFGEAIESYQKVDAIRPSWANYSNIGVLYHWGGDMDAAIESYKKAIALAPNQPDPYGNLADALRKIGQEEAAKRNYRLAIEQVKKQLSVNDQDAYTVASLAFFQAKLGAREEASANLRRALALGPQDKDVLYCAASVHALGGEKEAACSALTAALGRGFSKVMARHTDEFASLAGCAAFEDLRRTVK